MATKKPSSLGRCTGARVRFILSDDGGPRRYQWQSHRGIGWTAVFRDQDLVLDTVGWQRVSDRKPAGWCVAQLHYYEATETQEAHCSVFLFGLPSATRHSFDFPTVTAAKQFVMKRAARRYRVEV